MNISWERLNKIFKDGGQEALNEEWDKMFEEFLLTIPEDRREKMRMKQWVYKRRMERIKNPIARFAEAKKRMFDSVLQLNDVLNNGIKVNTREAKIYELRKDK